MNSLGFIVIPDGDISRIRTPLNASEKEVASERCDLESAQDLLRNYAYLTPEQVARVLQSDLSTVYRKLRNHQIPGGKRSGKWLVPTSELIDVMATPEVDEVASAPSPPPIGRAAARRGRLSAIHAEGDRS